MCIRDSNEVALRVVAASNSSMFNSDQQASCTSSVAAAINQLGAAAQEIAQNAALASQHSSDARSLAEDGQQVVDKTIAAMHQLSAKISSSCDNIETLNSSTVNIGQILEVITSISQQTNLLALNAAIEAARAGEQGRGFAVVADEVRALAHRTQQSTQEIEQMITAIQADSTHAVSAMNVSAEMASSSISVAQNADLSLKQIAQAITQINERNLLIATASEEQAQVAREADQNLTSIRELSIQSSAGASQTASACGEMANLAIELNRLVARFKV